jgi:hypothetical protein
MLGFGRLLSIVAIAQSSCCTLGASVEPEDDASRAAWLDVAIEEPTAPPDTWSSLPEADPLADPLPSEFVSEVRTSEFRRAMAKLVDTPAVSISRCEANRLSATPLEAAEGRSPFLMRGLMFSRQTGRFEVSEQDRTVWVAHGSLGGTGIPLRRWPVIAMLVAAPERVYVSASLAE